MTPVTDLPTPQSLGREELSQFEATIITENVDLPVHGPEIGASIRLDSTLENPVSAAKNGDKLSLTEDEPEGAEEENVESLAGMLDNLYNGETLPILSELDVAFNG